MLKQFCRACGNEVFSNGTIPLEFCTNCGARLPLTQSYSPAPQTNPYTRPGGGAKLSGKEKTAFGVLIAIPIILILATVGVVGLLVYVASKKQKEFNGSYPTPRTNTSPTPSNRLLAFGKDGIGNGEFKNAESVAIDKDGNIYVGDGTLRIQKFDAEGKFLQLWNVTEGTVKPDEKYYNAVSNMVIDSKNRLYAVVDHKDLLRYDAATGKFIDKIKVNGEKWMGTAEEATIQDVVILNDDRLAVYATSFPEGEYVIMVSPDGKPEIKFKELLKKQDKKTPVIERGSMLVNVTGDIFLMNGMMTFDKTYLYHFKPDGSYVDRFTWDGAPTLGGFGNKIIALNSKGEIYAYNSAKSQISVLSVEGIPLRAIPLKPEAYSRMILDANDNIYVVSRNRVEKFSASGS
jgi:hypothetical protein